MVNQFDVVHVNQIFTGLNVHFCGLAKLKQIPCFATDHGGGELFFRAISRVCANLPDSFISVSRYSSEYLQHLAPNKKSFIAYGGVDTTLFNPDYDVAFLRDFLGLREYKVVLCVGRLLSCKGFDIVIKAFYKLPKNTKLIIVGPIFDQTYFAYLKELARPLGSRVIFIGQVPDSDLPKYYNLCDIFVRASVNFDCFGHKYNFPELLGLVKFEAMACGKPVVVSDVGGLPEQVIDGKHGYVVKAGSDVMLANALLVLLSDDDLRKQMGMNSYKFVRKYFSWRSIAENVIRFYNGG
jgi:glycosyltransferase involved in cell wall biosynthesis